MTHCPECNASLEPDLRYCPACGLRQPRPRPGGAAATVLVTVPAIVPATDRPGGGAARPTEVAPKAATRRAAAPRRANQPDDPHAGKVLDQRFQVESLIGSGSFGRVYRGVELATSRPVALKILEPDLGKDSQLVARLRRDSAALCKLRDAHTATTYGIDQDPDGTLYIAMELLEGKSLHQVIHEEGPLDWRRVVRILTEVCSSLAEAHGQGIVHGDLKPENVHLVTRPGHAELAKVLDFGIASALRVGPRAPPSPRRRMVGVPLLGAIEYMSPEQLNARPLDGRSDLHAVGVLGHEMLTGRLPFPDAKGAVGLLIAQTRRTPEAPSQAAPRAAIPRAVDRLILQCLEKDRAHRFADAAQLAAALQDALAAAPAPAR